MQSGKLSDYFQASGSLQRYVAMTMTSPNRSKKSPTTIKKSSPGYLFPGGPPAVNDLRKPFPKCNRTRERVPNKAAFEAGRLSREEAVRQLQALGFQ
jgi:hypothetical protein